MRVWLIESKWEEYEYRPMGLMYLERSRAVRKLEKLWAFKSKRVVYRVVAYEPVQE